MRSCTGRRREFPGATFPKDSARGKPCSTVSRIGPSAATGQRSSKRYSSRMRRTPSSSMPPSCEPTRMLRAEKGDHHQCSWSLSGWVLHESPRSRRQQRAAAPPRAHRRATARSDGRQSDHRQSRAWQSLDRGYRIRLRRDPSAAARARHEASHSSSSRSKEEAPASIEGATRVGIESRCSFTA